MQIVIEIPENQYEILCKQKDRPCRLLIEKAITDGIILPKGHGDLIDRDACLKMKCRDLVDADGVTMYAVPTGNILRMDAVIPADKDGENRDGMELL